MIDAAPRNVDLAAERAVLGAVLLQPEAWSWYAEAGIQAGDFWRSAHADTFRACQGAEASMGRVDGPAVTRLLMAANQLEAVGGAGYLFGLTDGLPAVTRATAAQQVRHLRRLARTRNLAQAARQLAEACEDAALGLDDAECAARLATLDTITASGAELRVLDAEAQVLRGLAYQAERQQARTARFGVPQIDALIDGIRPGRSYGVVARTSVGKTAFACHVAATHGLDKAGMLFFTLEMVAEEIVGRLARAGLKVADADHRIGSYADDYIRHYGTVGICDKPGLTLAQVEQLIRSQQRHRTIHTAVIDYLGLLRPSTRGLSAYEGMSEIAKELKEVAKRCRVALLVLIQVSRKGGGDGSEEIGLDSSRDSGVIEEAVDVGIGLRWLGAAKALSQDQRTTWRDVIWARVFKNRHGPVGMAEHALRRDPRTMALTPDDALEFPDEMLRAATKAAAKGGY
jgi:replicative DNA helicase